MNKFKLRNSHEPLTFAGDVAERLHSALQSRQLLVSGQEIPHQDRLAHTHKRAHVATEVHLADGLRVTDEYLLGYS